MVSSGLLEIIANGYNIDANGDTIDDSYIENNTAIEIQALKKLEEEYYEIERLIRLGLQTDSIHWNSIDSLTLFFIILEFKKQSQTIYKKREK